MPSLHTVHCYVLMPVCKAVAYSLQESQETNVALTVRMIARMNE